MTILTLHPVNNYLQWSEDIIQEGISKFELIQSLPEGKLREPVHVIDAYEVSFFHGTQIPDLVNMDPDQGPIITLYDAILRSQSILPIVTDAKKLILAERTRLLNQRAGLFVYLMSSMDNSSKVAVTSHHEFQHLRSANEVFGLWKIISSIHLEDVISLRIEMAAELESMKLRNINQFHEHVSLFLSRHKALKKIHYKKRSAELIQIFFQTFSETRLQETINSLIPFKHSDIYPKKLDQAIKFLNDAVLPMLKERAVPQTFQSTEGEVVVQAVMTKKRRDDQERPECDLCGKRGHLPSKCFTYKKLIARVAELEKEVNNKRTQAYSCCKGVKKSFTLDTGSNAHILNEIGMFTTLQECREPVTGVTGTEFEITKEGPTKFGKAYYIKECPLNLLSMSVLIENGYAVTLSEDAKTFTVKKENMIIGEFQLNVDGLYHCDIIWNTTTLSVNHYTAEQRYRAELVKVLHYDLNHPSDDQLIDLMNSTCLHECPLTAADVRTSARINGPCPHCVTGKFQQPGNGSSESTPASRVGELLHTDIVFFAEGKRVNVPYLVVVDDHSDYIHCVKMVDKKTATIFATLKNIIHEYKAWGHTVSTIRSDYEATFKAVKSDINSLGIRMEYAAPHPPKEG